MPMHETDGAVLFYNDGGVEWQPGRPLAVLIHGAGNDSTVWALQSRSLGQHGFNVAALDLPGHGRSPRRPELKSIEQLSDLVLDFCDSQSSESAPGSAETEDARPPRGPSVALIGHSMGACVALSAAASVASQGRPTEIDKLVLVGAGQAMPVNPSLLEATLHRPLEAHRFITAFGYGAPSHFGGAESPGVWNLGAAFALLERTSPEVLHGDFAACNDWRSDALVANVACETLVVSGALDRMTPARSGAALCQSIQGARYESIPQVGHMIMAEAPTALRRLLLEFLAPESR
jgi:pimeloyl-ACP methyl ester carboxylesterase